MKFTWVSPSKTTIEFHKDATVYRLLKPYSGLSINPITHITQVAPYQHGETLINSRFEPREVSFDVMVQAPSLEDIQSAIKTLSAALNPLEGTGVLLFDYEDGTQYVLYAIGNNTPTLTEEKGATYQRVRLDFIAYDPFWYGAESIAYFESAGTDFFPLDISGNFLASSGTSQVLTNAGNVDTPVTISITGIITNPYLQNTTTDQSFNITLIMADASDNLTITTAFGNKTATYTPGSTGMSENAFKYFDADSVFWQLQPGDNTVSLSSLSVDSACVVSVQWESKYSGI